MTNSTQQETDDRVVDKQAVQQANAFYNRGNTYAASGKMDAAIQDYTQAIRLNPEHVDAYHNRGNAYAALGNLEAAIEDYDHVLTIQPDDVFAYTNRGSAYAKLRNPEAALQDYTKAIQLDPTSADTYYNRGDTYLEMGQFEAAIHDFTHVIRLAPDDAEAYYQRGIEQMKVDQIGVAIDDFTQAITLNPRKATWYYHRGKAYLESGKATLAIQDFTEAIVTDPRYTDILPQRSAAYRQIGEHDKADADDQLYHALHSSDETFQTFMEKGLHAHDSGKYEESLIWYTEAWVEETSAWAAYEFGYSYLKMRRYEKAFKVFQTAVAIDPKYSQAYAQMGFILSTQHDYTTSNLMYFMAFVLEPENNFSLLNIAVNLSMSNPQLALDFYRLLIQRFPDDVLILYNLSQLSEDTETVYSTTDMVYSTIEDIDNDHLLTKTIKYFTRMTAQTQAVHKSEIAYFIALTFLAHNKVEEAKVYLQQCINGEDDYAKNACRAVIEQEYHVERTIRDQEFLHTAKSLLKIPDP